MKKIILSILLLLTCSLIFTACNGFPSEMQKSMYDDDEAIAQEGDSYFFLNYSENKNIGDEMSLEFRGFTGTRTIWDTTSDKDETVIIQHEANISKGKYKLVLIREDRAIDEVEIVDNVEQTYDLKHGRNRLKIVGLKTNGSISVAVKS